MKRNNRIPALLLAAGLSGYLLLLVITLLHRQPPLHDEPYFLANVVLYNQHGLTDEFLLTMKDQAPGPLYQFVHSILSPVTNLDVPGIRLVNVAFLGLLIILTAVLMQQMWGLKWVAGLTGAINIMAAPVIWQVSGMALTEIPSMLFCFLSVVLLWFALKTREWYTAILLIVPAGLLAGLGILGRTPFLMLIPAAWIALALYQRVGETKQALTLLLYTAIALAVSLPVFFTWQGLTPPHQAYIGGGIHMWHGILGFSYAAMITLLIAPGWFTFNRKIAMYLMAGYVLSLILNLTIFHFTYSPLNKALGKVMPAAVMQLYPYLISPLLTTLAVYYIICLLSWLRKSMDNPFNVFLLTVVALLLCSNLAVTHLFSSRYIAQIVPFLVLVLWQADRLNNWKVWRYVLGMGIGILSLETYFNFQ